MKHGIINGLSQSKGVDTIVKKNILDSYTGGFVRLPASVGSC
jgi:hypothetical protein